MLNASGLTMNAGAGGWCCLRSSVFSGLCRFCAVASLAKWGQRNSPGAISSPAFDDKLFYNDKNCLSKWTTKLFVALSTILECLLLSFGLDSVTSNQQGHFPRACKRSNHHFASYNWVIALCGVSSTSVRDGVYFLPTRLDMCCHPLVHYWTWWDLGNSNKTTCPYLQFQIYASAY